MTAHSADTPETDVSQILQAVESPASRHHGPSDPRNAPALIVTVGLPGSGKSTFCRRLRDEIGAVILESDALRRVLFARPGYSATESRRLFSALYGAAGELLRHGRDVIIDATNLKESDRSPVYRLAEVYGARLLLLRFEARRDVTERRLELRSRGHDPEDSSTAGPRVYRMMAATAEEPSRPYLRIDTSDAINAEAALRSVVEACEPVRARKG